MAHHCELRRVLLAVYGYPEGAYSTPGVSGNVNTDGNMGDGQGSSG